MSPRNYTAYGLIFQSELDFPELLEGSGQPDVILQYGEVPDQLDSFSDHSKAYQFNESQFLLNLDGIARFWVHNGDRIVIQPASNGLDSEIRLFLFGTCLGVLLHQRGILALHASAIETPKGAVLFTGPSGIGKSTLMSAFLAKGYYMLADDVCGIILNQDGLPIVLPAIPRSKLWSDTISQLGYDLDTLPRLRPSEDKFSVNVRERFSHHSVLLSHIYLLSITVEEKLEIEPLDNLAGFQVLLYNTYREKILTGLDKRQKHLQLATTAVEHAKISRVSRPEKFSLLDEMVELLEGDFLA